MKPVFIGFMVILSLLVTFVIFPPVNEVLTNFTDNIMPGLDFGTTIEAYVGAFPLILLALFVICSFWILRRGG